MRAFVGAAFITVSIGCDGGDVADPCIPPISRPPSVTVTEGSSATFEMSLIDPKSCPAGGHFYFYTQSGKPAPLSADPPGFALSQEAPALTVTVFAAADADSIPNSYVMEFYISGAIANESPGLGVTVLEP